MINSVNSNISGTYINQKENNVNVKNQSNNSSNSITALSTSDKFTGNFDLLGADGPLPNVFTPILGAVSGLKMAHGIYGHHNHHTGLTTNQVLLHKTSINIGLETIIYGGASAIKSGIDYSNGKISKGELAGNVTTDVMAGALKGVGASVGGGAGIHLSKALRAGGVFGTIAATVGGIAGAYGTGVFIDQADLRGTMINLFNSDSDESAHT